MNRFLLFFLFICVAQSGCSGFRSARRDTQEGLGDAAWAWRSSRWIFDAEVWRLGERPYMGYLYVASDLYQIYEDDSPEVAAQKKKDMKAMVKSVKGMMKAEKRAAFEIGKQTGNFKNYP